MKYFVIENSLNKKIMGKVEQSKDYIHNCHVWDDPCFIDRFPFQEIKINPILSNPILHSSSKLTDKIWVSSIGFTYGSMVISNKLKFLLEEFNLFGLQFFKTFIIQNNTKIEDYWQTHISKQAFELLDFEKIDFFYKKRINENVIHEKINNINSIDDFMKYKQEIDLPTEFYFTNLVLKNEKFDFFFLPHYINGTGKGIVSNRLKIEMEKQEITGIEFRPIELSLQDWYHSGEREKSYGKL